MKLCRIIFDGRPREISTDALRLMYQQGSVNDNTEVLFEGSLKRLGDSPVRFEWYEFAGQAPQAQGGYHGNQNRGGAWGDPAHSNGYPADQGYGAPGFSGAGYYGQGQPQSRGGLHAGWIVLIVALAIGVIILGGVVVGLHKEGAVESQGAVESLLSQKNQAVCDVMDQYKTYTVNWITRMEELGAVVEANSNPDGFWEGVGASATILGAFKQMKACSIAYRDNFRIIDVSECPSDFVVAWREYTNELDKMIDLMDRMTQLNWGTVGAWSEFMSIKDTEGERLERLTTELQEVAESYGWDEGV